MFRRIKRKLDKSTGESLAETLVAMIIATLGMMIMAGAIITSAKMNDTAGRVKPFSGNEAMQSSTILLNYGGVESTISVNFTNYNEEGEDKGTRSVYFYEANN